MPYEDDYTEDELGPEEPKETVVTDDGVVLIQDDPFPEGYKSPVLLEMQEGAEISLPLREETTETEDES